MKINLTPKESVQVEDIINLIRVNYNLSEIDFSSTRKEHIRSAWYYKRNREGATVVLDERFALELIGLLGNYVVSNQPGLINIKTALFTLADVIISNQEFYQKWLAPKVKIKSQA